MTITFADALFALRGRLVSEGRRYAAPGFFLREAAPDHVEWITVSGNAYMLNVGVGIVRPDVWRAAAETLAAAGAPADTGRDPRLGPPLALLSLPRCAEVFGGADPKRLLPTGERLSHTDLDAAGLALEGPAMGFFHRCHDLDATLDFLLRTGKLTDGQPHLAVVALAMAGRAEAFEAAVSGLASPDDGPEAVAAARRFGDVARTRWLKG